MDTMPHGKQTDVRLNGGGLVQEHCSEHEERGICLVVAKKDAQRANIRCDNLEKEVRARVPIWVFSLAVVVNGLLIAGVFTVLMVVNTKIDANASSLTKLLAVEEYKHDHVNGRIQ